MRLLILLVVVGALALGLHMLFPDALRLEHNRMSLVYYLVWIAVIGSAILMTFRQRWSQAVKHAIAWALILLVVIAAYAYKDDLEQVAMHVAAAVVPGLAVETAPGEVVLRASADGHFYATATVDGVAVRFLVDTGASSITLSAADARRVGFDPEALDYFLPVTTASGSALAARVRLDEVRLGSIALQDVTAAVMPPVRSIARSSACRFWTGCRLSRSRAIGWSCAPELASGARALPAAPAGPLGRGRSFLNAPPVIPYDRASAAPVRHRARACDPSSERKHL